MTDFTTLTREARSKATPPERLLELATLGPELSRVVARSVNTPPEVLVALTESADWYTQALAIGNRKMPVETLQLLIDDSSKYRILAWHWRDLPPDRALQFLQSPDSAVRHTILVRQWHTHPIRKRRGQSPYRLLEPLALEAIVPILHDESEANRELAAVILGRMDSTRFHDITVLKREARKKGTTPKRLFELAAIGPVIARELTRSVNTPPEVLRQMIDMYSDDDEMLAKIGSHPNASVDTLRILAQKVPWVVAGNRAAPDFLLRQLSRHPNSSVYERVVYNPSTPIDVVLRLLSKYEGRFYSLISSAKEVLGEYAKGTRYSDDVLLRSVAFADVISEKAAVTLAVHPSSEIKKALIIYGNKIE